MSKRLNQEREAELEPTRLQAAMETITNLGFTVEQIDKSSIKFTYDDRPIIYYPYSGWATGKSIKDGRGLDNLTKQLVPF